jgi:hypothetical protein
MTKKIIITNSSQNWNAKKRYKINEIVTHNGIDYQNTTGANSEPGVGSDWVVLDLIGGIGGTQYYYVAGNGTPTQNATELQTAYDLAKTISGLSATNRFKIIVGTGKYEFTGQFLINTQYIDFVSLTNDADVEFTNGINVTANNVFLKGLKTSLPFQIATNLNLLICDTCIGGHQSFGGNTIIIVSGTFNNCVANTQSFGGSSATSSGIFNNCVAGGASFAQAGGATGIFNNCVAGSSSFGSTASGTFNNCVAGTQSLGSGTASGTFTNCIGGNESFGNNSGGGVLTGKLFYCRLTSGTFQTVSGAGRTYYCVDGNGNPNNQ